MRALHVTRTLSGTTSMTNAQMGRVYSITACVLQTPGTLFPGPAGHDAAAVALLLEDPDREVDRRMGQLQGAAHADQQQQQQQQQPQDALDSQGHDQGLQELLLDPHRLTHGSMVAMATSVALPQLSPQELDQLLPMATYSCSAAGAAEGAGVAGPELEAGAQGAGDVCSRAQRGGDALAVDDAAHASAVPVSTLVEEDARAPAPASATSVARPMPPALLLPPASSAAMPSPPSLSPSAAAPPTAPSPSSGPAHIPLQLTAEPSCSALAQEQGVSPGPVPAPGAAPAPAAVVGGTPECAVCSEVFQEGEPVALLPCQHFFHSRWGPQLPAMSLCSWLGLDVGAR